MKKLKTRLFIIAAIFALAISAAAQNSSNPVSMENILKQGTEYDLLKSMEGKWAVKMTVYKINSKEIANEFSVQMERKMMGNFLQETMTPAAKSDPNPFTRMSYLNYNRINKRWEYSVFDTRFPISMNEQSVEPEIKNNAITVYLDNFIFPSMFGDKYAGLLAKQRRIITFGKDENTNEQYMTLPGGEEFLAIKYVFKRIE